MHKYIKCKVICGTHTKLTCSVICVCKNRGFCTLHALLEALPLVCMKYTAEVKTTVEWLI